MSTIKEAQSWSAEGYARNARFVADLGQPVLELLAPRPGERILDLGCGDGALTVKLVQAGADVVGADASAELVAAARALGLDARIADGQALAFGAEFDAVFSNAALHWMRQPDAVIAGVRRALKPGGRFVGEFGGHGNVAAIVTALVAALNARGLDGAARVPWFFPTPAEYAAKLEAQGFRVDSIGLVPRPTPLPTGMRGWLGTFANPFLDGVDEAARGPILDEVQALLAPSLRDQSGNWSADYVRLRFAATLAS
ncbi:class I SAM-dependent methyltransferase [Inquilinus sp.]|jgi:trans-aconitate methyltransferase|uniref:class I SAM-dependent methyltransferase n=1 Tax=Inquilinus sp. TaxID=1932117 RepID=UPI0037840827